MRGSVPLSFRPSTRNGKSCHTCTEDFCQPELFESLWDGWAVWACLQKPGFVVSFWCATKHTHFRNLIDAPGATSPEFTSPNVPFHLGKVFSLVVYREPRELLKSQKENGRLPAIRLWPDTPKLIVSDSDESVLVQKK